MKYWLTVLASFLTLSVLGFSQSPNIPPELLDRLGRMTQPKVKLNCPPPPLVDPSAIKKWIEENPECNRRPVWDLLRIDEESFDNAPNEACKVELRDVYLSSQKAMTKMLEITLYDAAYYLFFSRSDGEVNLQAVWRFVGTISSQYQQYGPPDWRIESGNKCDWFVINELRGRGTGVLLRGESWYEITSSGIKEVLSYPVTGHDSNLFAFTNRSFQAIPVFFEADNSTVLITFVVNYETLLGAGIPLSRAQKAFFVRDETTGEFKLDDAQSEITEEELDAVYNFDSLDESSFLKYNRAALRKIIARAKPEQKAEWRKYFREINASGSSVLEELLK